MRRVWGVEERDEKAMDRGSGETRRRFAPEPWQGTWGTDKRGRTGARAEAWREGGKAGAVGQDAAELPSLSVSAHVLRWATHAAARIRVDFGEPGEAGWKH